MPFRDHRKEFQTHKVRMKKNYVDNNEIVSILHSESDVRLLFMVSLHALRLIQNIVVPTFMYSPNSLVRVGEIV
jgi:hypothetical protein